MYHDRGDVENLIKERKNTLRWYKMSCHRFAANQNRLLIGEELKRSMAWLIKRMIKVGPKVAYHGRRWEVHAHRPFPWLDATRLFFG
ncbi:MAG: transposase [Deltaproteobacteria bacterium]|nr:transposase [Deltaproteobacteria bacterium]